MDYISLCWVLKLTRIEHHISFFGNFAHKISVYCLFSSPSGMGDSNYAKFCRPAKDLDAMFQSRGANRFYATGLADDATRSDISLVSSAHVSIL
jgi:hypothetical protein